MGWLGGRRSLLFNPAVQSHCSSNPAAGEPAHLPVELAHEVADTQGKNELAIDHIQNLVFIAGEDEELVTVGKVFERAERRHRLRVIALEIVQAAADFCRLRPWP